MLTHNRSEIMNKHAEDQLVTIPDQDSFIKPVFSIYKKQQQHFCYKNSKNLSLKQSNNNIPKQMITTLNVHSKKNMVTNSKRQNNISSNSKNSKSKNVSVIIGDSIIKDIESWELSNESEKFVVKFFGGATTKNMESYFNWQ